MSIEPDAQSGISIGIWMGVDPGLKRSRAGTRSPRAGADGQAARTQAGSNHESDSGETPMRGHASGRTPQTSMMHGSPPHFYFCAFQRSSLQAASTFGRMPPRAGFIRGTKLKS
jgi:hypothetical protein